MGLDSIWDCTSFFCVYGRPNPMIIRPNLLSAAMLGNIFFEQSKNLSSLERRQTWYGYCSVIFWSRQKSHFWQIELGWHIWLDNWGSNTCLFTIFHHFFLLLFLALQFHTGIEVFKKTIIQTFLNLIFIYKFRWFWIKSHIRLNES